MNFTQLSTFQAVMSSASLSDAAKKLGRTQPAVSAAIKTLEDQLGLQLFERIGRKLVPVPEAKYLLAEADTILSQMSRVRQTMRSLSDGQTGTLRVASMPGPVSMIFPKFIASKISETDGISVSIQARTSNQIAELTRAQSIDFGFADAPTGVTPEPLYRSLTITADCPVALPESHRLTRKDQISFADLDNTPLGTLPMSHRQTVDIMHQFSTNGLTFRGTVESQTFLPVLHFVAAGQCATILDPLSIYLVSPNSRMVEGVVIRPMTDPIRYRYAIYWPSYRPISVIARKLLDAWREEVLSLLEKGGFKPELDMDG